MSIFGKIMGAIFGSSAADATAVAGRAEQFSVFHQFDISEPVRFRYLDIS